jgi:hypothetical protein
MEFSEESKPHMSLPQFLIKGALFEQVNTQQHVWADLTHFALQMCSSV